MNYTVSVRDGASPGVAALSAQDRKAFYVQLDILQRDPWPLFAAPLGDSGFWRLRWDDLRITYHVDEDTSTVTVWKVGRT